MADSKRYSDWFKKAHSDHIAAKILFEHGADYSLVAFHAQQAVEKALKGYILKNSGDLVDGHSLVFLIKYAQRFDNDIQHLRKDCAYLNQFYVETRYPADIPDEVTKDEALLALTTADKVIERIV
ncbi:MAG: HEPN domain-containing protein [Clostridia bacterium]|nr:HEPN domain-containing protein [Clostridia bacterium]